MTIVMLDSFATGIEEWSRGSMDSVSNSSMQTESATRYQPATRAVAATDRELLAKVGQQSRVALEVLYDRHVAKATEIAFEMLQDRAQTEHVIEEAFWWLWKYPSHYQGKQNNFTDWFYVIVQYLAFTELHRGLIQPLPNTPEELECVLKQNMKLVREETWAFPAYLTAEQIRAAFATLPAKQRQVIEYAYYKGLTRQEIADRLGVSIDIIATWARLGLAQFGKRIGIQE